MADTREVAPGVYSLGDTPKINFYAIEDAGRITVIDAGIPAYWGRLESGLMAMGRTLADVEAIVLTHAHVDHVGFAERLRKEADATVRVHEADLDWALGRSSPPRPSGILRLRALPFLWYMVRHRAFRFHAIVEASAFGDGETLDIPGAPRVLHLPGHTPGECALLLESKSVLFTGDALITEDILTGTKGPQLTNDSFNSDSDQALESLSRLDGVSADLILPGHGDPWTGGVAAAVAEARRRRERKD